MTKDNYDKILESLLGNLSKENLKLNQQAIEEKQFIVGSLVFCTLNQRIYEILEIDNYYGFNHKMEIRIFGRLYYKRTNKSSGNRTYLDWHQLVLATEEQIKALLRSKQIKQNNQRKKRAIEDPIFRLHNSLRARIRHAFKAKKLCKSNSTESLIGVKIEIAKKYIEKQFTKGMTWENYGKWHIDHIMPLSSAESEGDLKLLCHYTNLQPLWSSDNIKKSNKIIEHQKKLTL